ncbi:putative aminotransferase YhxA [Nymphon striatum]|nr:putative aminotransferase YhxA [Nymphon striatum]
MKDDNFLRENNARQMWHPMGHPGEQQENPPAIITKADAVDAVGGLWCVNLGYSNDVVKDAIAKQLYDLPYYSAFAGNQQSDRPSKRHMRDITERTLAVPSVNGNNRFRIAYEPLLPGCFHLPAPYTYRNPFDETDPAILAQKIAASMEDEIQFQGANTIAAFIMEPIQGAGGVIVPDPTFMKLMREICDRHGILMISDEVITGFGRTGRLVGRAALGR